MNKPEPFLRAGKPFTHVATHNTSAPTTAGLGPPYNKQIAGQP
jgi:hypothetical protein